MSTDLSVSALCELLTISIRGFLLSGQSPCNEGLDLKIEENYYILLQCS